MVTRSDSLTLEVNDLVVDVLTGIYSEETGKPQPLRISIAARYAVADRLAQLPRGPQRDRQWQEWQRVLREAGGASG